ncbi:hypothetical protein BJX61DRAFT_364911 [Aspergillus egyptiacus]|nr:hypothetical protein BJX61DRAFT_364911 [Aspergillus egyptiacus]
MNLGAFAIMLQTFRARATAIAVLKHKLIWCLHCFRTSLKSFELINCRLDTKKLIVCC